MINEMAYPQSFNMEEFKQLTSYRKRIAYCDKHLEEIGAGSSRVVYKIDDDKCLKLAKNDLGLAQNETEDEPYYRNSDLFTIVYDNDEEYLWIEAELARPAKKSDFKEICGYSFDVICDWINYCYNSCHHISQHVKVENKELFNSDEFDDNYEYSIFAMLQEYIGDWQLKNTGDLKRISSWGVVTRDGTNELVLLDYGFNDKVAKLYYE